MTAPEAGRGSSAPLCCYSALFKILVLTQTTNTPVLVGIVSSQCQQFPPKPGHTHFSILRVLRLLIVRTSFTSFSFHKSPKRSVPSLCPYSVARPSFFFACACPKSSFCSTTHPFILCLCSALIVFF